MTTTNQALQSGRQALAQAAQELGIVLSEQALYWLLGQAWRENGLGLVSSVAGSKTEQFLGTNNWGSVYWPSETQPPNPYSKSWKPGRDYNPAKGWHDTRIAVYETPVDGAKGFLSVVKRYGQEAMNALASGTVQDFSRALYKRGYYVGYYCGQDKQPSLRLGRVNETCAKDAKLLPTQAEADEANIRDYANLIQAGANEARKANQAPLEAPIPPGPVTNYGTSRFPWGLAASLVLLGVVANYALTRKGHRLPGLSKLRFT